MPIRTLTAITAAISTLAAAAPDAVYTNANVHTMDDAKPRAQAFAVEDGRITAVGNDADILALADDNTQTIDLGGATVVPGLIDAHGHLSGLGAVLTGVVDLSRTRTFDEVIALTQQRAEELPAGSWVVGRGWDNESWPDKALPTHDALSEAIPEHPVWLSRVDGHAALANAAAMQAAGIDNETTSPPGGEILKNIDGSPTGVFVDNAETLVQRIIPATAYPSLEESLLAAQQACFAAGLTSVHDMGVTPGQANLYKQMEADGRLQLRVRAAIPGALAVRYFEQNEPYHTDRLSVRATKLYSDGAMGSRGAWLLEPYEDRPTGPNGEPYTGLAVSEPELIEAISKHALANGYQVFTHAIGDRGNRETLDAYERAANSSGVNLADQRFRVEHAQLLNLNDIPRFAQLGIIASMQARHCTSDMRWVEDRVGYDRAAGAYAWASLLRSGAIIANGSDFPVEPHPPLLGFYASVTRQNEQASPPNGWRPEERMTREEALRSFTLHAAYSSFDEDSLGSLEPGKLADFVVLDRDIMTVDPLQIPDAKIIMTVIGGETVYEAEATN